MKRLILSIFFIILLAGGSQAYAVNEITVQPFCDVSVGYSSADAASSVLKVSNGNGDVTKSYKAYISYKLNGINKQTVTGAGFCVEYMLGATSSNEKLKVFGIPDGMDGLTEDISWESAPCNNVNEAGGLTEDAVLLGELVMNAKYTPILLTGEALADFIREDTNGIITLAVVRESARNSTWSLASSRNKSYKYPVLTVYGEYESDKYGDIAARSAALPERSEAEKIKKAAVEWAAEEAGRLFLEGYGEEARSVLDDAEEMLCSNIGARTGNLPVHRVVQQNNNPYIPGLEDKARGFLAEDNIYHKSWEWSIKRYTKASALRSAFSDRLEILSFLLCADAGEYSGSPEALKEVFDCLEMLSRCHSGGDLNAGRSSADANMNRFVYASYNIALYEIINTYGEEIIPKTKLEGWLGTVSETAAYQYDSFGSINTKQPHGAGYYANMDACYTCLTDRAGRLLGNEVYISSAEERSRRMEEYMCGSGAFPYLGYANESPTYHEVDLKYLAEYYLASGNEQTAEMIAKTADYYPMTIERNSLIEYSTTLYFKQYWHRADPAAAEMAAYFSRDGRNRALAQDILDSAGTQGSVMGAVFYDGSLEQVRENRSGAVYDRNIMGPRGRYSLFSYYANGRDWKDDRGKPTLIGAMAKKAEEDDPYPISGAVCNVYGAVYDTAEHAYHIMQETAVNAAFDMEERHAVSNSSVICGDASAFSSVYYLQSPVSGGGRSRITDWGGTQEWLMLPDRIVGVVSTNARRLNKAYGFEGVIQLSNGSGENISPQKLSDTEYIYGDLNIKIHDNNFGSISVGAPSYSEITVYGSTQYIKLNDTDLSKSVIYQKNDERYYVVEIRRSGTEAAEVSRTSENGIDCLRVSAGGREYFVCHNTADETAVYTAPEYIKKCSVSGRTFFCSPGESVEIGAYKTVLMECAGSGTLETVLYERFSDGEYTAEVSAANTGTESKNIMAAAAVYSKSGRLLAVQLTKETAGAGSVKTMLCRASAADGASGKVFVWDGNMCPAENTDIAICTE